MTNMAIRHLKNLSNNDIVNKIEALKARLKEDRALSVADHDLLAAAIAVLSERSSVGVKLGDGLIEHPV